MLSKKMILLAIAVAASVLTIRASSSPSFQGPSVDARSTPSSDGTARVEGHEAFDFDADVGGVLDFSSLPVTVDVNGSQVRAVSAVLMYQKRTAYMGHAYFHQLVLASSTQVIDLSVSGLDLSIDAESSSTPAELRSYRATLTLRNGKTWGTVSNFAEDVLLESSPQ